MARPSSRRRFLKQGSLFVPAAFAILRARGQNIMSGPIMRTIAAAGGGGALLTNLTSVWEMEQADNSDAPDAYGGKTLTRTGSTVQRATHIQGSFSGSASPTSYWTSSDAAFQTTGSFSAIIWINSQSVTLDGDMIMGRWQTDLAWLVWGQTPVIVFTVRKIDNSGNWTATSTINVENNSNWHLVAVTYNDSTKDAKISVDNESQVTVNTGGIRSNSDVLKFAATVGYVDESAFWAGRVLSTSDISEIWASGAGKFYSAW